MINDTISRRDVLEGVGAGLGTIAATGSASSKPDGGEVLVGVDGRGPARNVARQASEHRKTMDFGGVRQVVHGRFPEEALEGLQHNPHVEYVEPNEAKYRTLGQTLPWGIDRVDADVVHSNDETGNGADVAIVDTGIDDDHEDLQANVGTGKAFVDCKGSNCNEPWSDDKDHGTHCAGIAGAADNDAGVVGVASEATLHAVKVLDKRGSGTLADIADGIRYVADQGWDVASLSLGASSGDQTLQDACQYAYDNGVLLVAAAGNNGPCSDCVGFPAAYSTVIAVSSTDGDDSLSSFSSTGPEVEIAAPGGSIYSTVIDGYDTYSGTSMACPHVSGAGAQLMADGYTNTEARDRLTSTAEDLGLGDNEQGSGLLDVEAALGGSSTESAPAVDGLSVSEVETSDSDAELDADWSVSDADGDLSNVELTLTDDTDGETEDTASVSVSGDTASGTTRLVAAGDDGSGNGYTVEIVVSDSGGNTASDSATVSETEDSGGDTAPAIDSYTVTEAGSPNPHAEITADWAVSDGDGDLSRVEVVIEETGDSSTTAVGGSSASGTDQFTIKQGGGVTYDVTLTVTDANGNTTSETRSVSA